MPSLSSSGSPHTNGGSNEFVAAAESAPRGVELRDDAVNPAAATPAARAEASAAKPVDLKVPRLYTPRSGFIKRTIARVALYIGGWTVETPPPDLDKFVVLAAPHTYWWDGFWMLAFAWRFGIRLSWLVKLSSTRGLMGWLVRRTGAVPVDRSSPQGLVQQLVEEFRNNDELVLVIPPEGTRAKRELWKSGFYHIARQSDVPIALSYLDYGRTAIGFGPCFKLTGNVSADMQKIRDFYGTMRGKIPENFTEPRLREELEELSASPATATATATDDERPAD